MDTEAQSIQFLEYHMENSFKKDMARLIIDDLVWLDEGEHALRAVAHMVNPTNPNKECNLICLFPPFFPNHSNKE